MDFSTNNHGDILLVFTGKQPSSTHVVGNSATGKKKKKNGDIACNFMFLLVFHSLFFGIVKQPKF